jgi:hypothetical protein
MESNPSIEKATFFCPVCNAITESVLLFSYQYNVNYQDELQGSGINVELFKCLNCGNPILTNEDYLEIEGEYFPQNKFVLFPEKESAFVAKAPKSIINSYREAEKCYKANAYEASVIMCRKGIDAICVEKGEIKGKLLDKLRNLKDKDLLEVTFFNWANRLREFGNIGAHSHDSEITKEDARDCLDFFEALIMYLYHLVNKYADFLKRKDLI